MSDITDNKAKQVDTPVDQRGSFTYKRKVRILTSATTLTAEDSNSLIVLNSATGFVVTLPAVQPGLHFEFAVGATAPSSGNHTIVTNGSANVIAGNISSCEVDDATDFGFDTDADTISFVASSAITGDWSKVTCDGTLWHVRGQSSVRAGLTLTQAT